MSDRREPPNQGPTIAPGSDGTPATDQTEPGFQAITERIGNGVIVVDAEEIVRYASPAAERLLGRRAEELEDQPFDYPLITDEPMELSIDRPGMEPTPIEIHITKAKWRGDPIYLAILHDLSRVKQMEQELRRRSHDLRERGKELQCLYGIAQVVETPGISLGAILEQSVSLLPPAWQYPELAHARIVLEDTVYTSPGFQEGSWQQTADLVVDGDVKGHVEVHYLEARAEEDEGPFLAEERSLIEAVAERLGRIIERMRAQTALQESEKTAHALLNAPTDAAALIDTDGFILKTNETTAERFQETPESLVGRCLWDLFPPEVAERRKKHLRRLLQTKEPVRFIDERGGMWHDNVAHPILDEKGKVRRIAILSRDITELKAAEQRIEHLKTVFRAIRNVNQLIAEEKSPKELIRKTCASLIETRGYHSAWTVLFDQGQEPVSFAQAGLDTKAAQLERRLAKGDFPQCIDRALAQDRAAVTVSSSTQCRECALVCKEGENAALTVKLEQAGDIYGLLTVSVLEEFASDDEEQSLFLEIASDLAFALYSIELEKQQQKTTEALRRSEERYRLLAETARDIICIHDMKGRIQYLNRAGLRFLGLDQEEALGVSIQDFIPAEEMDALQHRYRRRAAGDLEQRLYETELVNKKGERIPIEVSSSVLTANGEILGILIVARDITSRRETERRLKEHQTRLEEKVEKRTGELRTLVDAMAGREVRMAELKDVIRRLRAQLKEAGLKPVADDPLLGEGSDP